MRIQQVTDWSLCPVHMGIQDEERHQKKRKEKGGVQQRSTDNRGIEQADDGTNRISEFEHTTYRKNQKKMRKEKNLEEWQAYFRNLESIQVWLL